jgi:nucleotide-binding universal stress UspA family protein
MYQIDKPILVAIRLDETATEPLRQAVGIAEHYKVKLHVCHVLPDLLSVRPLFPHLQINDSFKIAEFEARARQALIARVDAFIKPEGETCELLIEYGTEHAAILEAAERIGAGLIVVGHGSDERSLSGISERVARYADCAVLIARPPIEGCVLAATDFSIPATPAVEAAASAAARLSKGLVILHSIDIARFIILEDASMSDLPPMDLQDEVREVLQARLDAAVGQFGAKSGILARGRAEAAILDAMTSLPASLIVMGTHGRSGLSRVSLGSVSEAVVRGAACSVLVVRLNAYIGHA